MFIEGMEDGEGVTLEAVVAADEQIIGGHLYERLIRSEETLNRIRSYIHDNPANWKHDHEHPDRPS
jgi:hypothetical protein